MGKDTHPIVCAREVRRRFGEGEAAVKALAALAGVVAAIGPARRAPRLDDLEALRAE